MMKVIVCASVLSSVLCAAVLAAPLEIEPTKTWKGSVAAEALEFSAPKVVVSQKSLDAIWDLWKQPGKAPQVDFAKEIVAVTTSGGSQINLIVQREEKNLKVFGFGTRDLRPGFRFVMGTVPREGIETIDGGPLPKE